MYRAALALISSIAFATLCIAEQVSVSYDGVYDDADDSLYSVACSDGANGLITKNYTTFGSLPTFPYIGGASAVAGYNSPSCGSCWVLTYTGSISGGNATGNGTSSGNGTVPLSNGTSLTNNITVLVIDHADGFNIAIEAFDALTNGDGESLGRIEAEATEVDPSVCGL